MLHHPDKDHIIDILAEAFEQNPRIQSMIRKKDPKRSLQILAQHAYYINHKRGRVYLSKDRSTVILYYRKRVFHRSLKDNVLYFLAFARACRLGALVPALRREKHVESLRKVYDDHIYVWALATVPGHRGLEGLADIRDHLFGKSKELGLPLLIETTVKRMLGFYRYVGFEQYHHWHDEEGDVDVWFLERKLTS